MTFLEIQDAVMNRLNLTSTDARTRIKTEINLRYREVQSSINMAATRRGTRTFTTTSGSSLTTQSGIAKVLNVFDPTYLKNVLMEWSLNQIRQQDPPVQVVGTSTNYAVENMVNNLITLRLYPQPTVSYDLQADCLLAGIDMVDDTDEPAIPTDFHDVLVHGVLYDELMKMEKMNPLALKEEAKFEKRLSDIRYFVAKSAWLRLSQTDSFLQWTLAARTWPYANMAP